MAKRFKTTTVPQLGARTVLFHGVYLTELLLKQR
jgi:hypothetical protein